MAAMGAYRNPTTRACWETCSVCGRCNKKGTSACPLPNSCSGRIDPYGQTDPHPDDWCDCKNGVLRWKAKKGNVIMVRYPKNPFVSTVQHEHKTEDERDWDSYLNDAREKLDNPDSNPIQVY